MNKALPWNINGVGFDAREAARQAARRQGKSIGEWLHGVIADHAAELGVSEQDIAGQDRIDAVTSRLERLGARAGGFDRKSAKSERTDQPRRRVVSFERDDEEQDTTPVRRSARRDEDEPYEERRPRRAAPAIEDTEFLLEEAIESMERRAQRSERRTDTALASFAKLLEANETKRERERDAVLSMAQKLNDIETRLSHAPSDETPIKGALARLEARLDMIGRRSAAESNAAKSGDGVEPMRRLEDKLNFILDAINDRPAPGQVSSAAIMASQSRQAEAPSANPLHNRRLGDAIAEISRRQRNLEEPAAARPVRRALDIAPTPDRDSGPRPASIGTIQGEISTLGSKIEEMRRDFMRRVDRRAVPPVDIDGLRSEIASLAQTLNGLAPHGTMRALDESVRTLTTRIDASRDDASRDAGPVSTTDLVDNLRSALAGMDQSKMIGALQTEIRSIGSRIEDLSAAGIDRSSVDRIHQQMAEIRDLVTSTSRPSGTETIEQSLASLSSKLDHAIHAASHAGESAPHPYDPAAEPRHAAADVSGLERLVRDLAGKIEATQAPGADTKTIEALERQIGVLSTRFESAENGLASLSNLEQSMQTLFAHLEETRSNVETAAARAAREVLRVAADESRDHHNASRTDQDIALLRSLQDEADQRTHSTLNAVHETLEKVVDRLSTMEDDIADVRSRATAPAARDAASALDAPIAKPAAPKPAAPRPTIPSPVAEARDAPPAAPIKAPPAGEPRAFHDLEMMLGAPDPLVAPVQKPARPQPGSRNKAVDLDDEAGRADFIAAARRAAKAAQNDPSVMAMKRPPVGTPNSEARAGLIERSRDYVAAHKRPVLLSIAAIMVIIGTMAIMQRIGLEEQQVAEATSPAKIQRVADATPRKPVMAAIPTVPASGNPVVGDLSPSALPTSHGPAIPSAIPGSDPIQTGSIPSLPAFAAQGASASPPITHAILPTGLTSMAESGDAAAAYELGSRYAEGKLVQRDFATAAKWYAKAADQGLAPAQYRLASLYEKGLGVTQDKAKAKALYLKAADAGNPRAMHNLAVLLADGNGKPDYEGAATWFRKAALFGVHDSQFNLAILLARGLGVQQSLVQSYQWFAIAADQNDEDAAKKRDEVGSKLSANDLAVAKALASSYRPRSPTLAATEVSTPPGGWDGAPASFHINSARPKISSL